MGMYKFYLCDHVLSTTLTVMQQVEAVAGLIRFLNVILARGRDKSSPTWKADVQTFVTKIRSAHRRIEWDPS